MTEVVAQPSPFASLAPVPEAVNFGKFGFTAKRHNLYERCEHAAAVVPQGKDASPALASFQVRVSPDYLRIAATDMDRVVITGTKAMLAEGVHEGQVAEAYIPARRFLGIIREAPEGDVVVKVNGNKAVVTVSNGFSAELRLPDASAYPALVSPDDIGFAPYGREKFLAALRSVRHAVCKDASISNLTQVAISADGAGQVNITASDSARLARTALADFPVLAAVPASALGDLVRLLAASHEENLEAGHTAKLVAFRVSEVLLAVQKRTTPFPDVDAQLINPASANDQKFVVDKAALQAAIRRVRINADSGTAAIALWIAPEHVAVVAKDKEGNSARETVQAKWDGPGAERLVVVSHVALDEALAAYPGTTCQFWLGADKGKRRSMVLLDGGTLTQVLTQLQPSLVGY